MMPFVSSTEFINWVQVQKRFSKKVSLDKMRYFCRKLGNPESKFQSIHITGTNGKGSTVAMLAKVLMQHGYHVGTFTSPYIRSFHERISFDMKPIDDQKLLQLANQIIEKYPIFEEDGFEMPTFFEFITLVAFLYFAYLPTLDYAIIEVGMGGRLDSTNVITPILSIITNVALDHMAILGNTKEEILTEKLGIVKPNIPVVCGLKEEGLKKIATDVSNQQHSELVLVDYAKLDIQKSDLSGSIFSYKEFSNVYLSLVGFHQIENALIVLESYKVLQEKLHLNPKDTLYALSTVSWIGRMEKVSTNPLIFIDGSHNIDGISRVCEFIRTLDFHHKIAVVSISHDKELQQMVDEIDKTVDEVVFTKYTYARSAEPQVLYELSRASNKIVIENIDDAIQYVKEKKGDFTIFMGSLYLVSEIRNKKNLD